MSSFHFFIKRLYIYTSTALEFEPFVGITAAEVEALKVV